LRDDEARVRIATDGDPGEDVPDEHGEEEACGDDDERIVAEDAGFGGFVCGGVEGFGGPCGDEGEALAGGEAATGGEGGSVSGLVGAAVSLEPLGPRYPSMDLMEMPSGRMTSAEASRMGKAHSFPVTFQ
jgi:hypothetical protein